MSDSNLFTADHNGFYREGTPFHPLIQETTQPLLNWSNTVLVRLPAHLNDDLNWSKEKECAEQIVAAGKFLFWEIDLNLHSFPFHPEDSASFYAFSLAIEEFSKQIWLPFQNHTFGVCLYRGGFDPLRSFPMAQWEAAFLECAAGQNLDYSLYCAQVLSEYLQRLTSFLPDPVLPFALFDISTLSSSAQGCQLFSKTRFEHLHLALKGARVPFPGICWEEGEGGQGWLGSKAADLKAPSPPSVGVYLPGDAHIDPRVLQGLDRLISDLKEKKTPFRVVPEEKLTEQWDGLDQLIVFSSALSPQGRRKLLGFEAAGGIVTAF